MNITNFEQTGLNEIEGILLNENTENINDNALREILKYANISFVLEGINRLQSTLICELKASYVQQSQRYVTLKEDSFDLPKLGKEDKLEAEKLLKEAFELYEDMSKLKEGEFKGRPKAENYLHGIPIEDARYILPLACKTNVSIAMNGEKLVDLFYLFNDKNYKNIFEDINENILRKLPSNLSKLLSKVENGYNRKHIENFYKSAFDKISEYDNIILLNNFQDLDLKVGLGAITSTNAKTPSSVMKLWGDNANEKAKGVSERVLGYGHESIAEQARTNLGMMCSMVTYHQQIRHRLSENYREELLNIIENDTRKVVIPNTIRESEFYDRFVALTDKFKEFRKYILKEYGEAKALNFLLNCDQVKLVISTNARVDCQMLADRICFNAQWEIRELSTKKLQELRKLSEVLYKKALPSCVFGKCKEGKFTCGKQMIMKNKFA
ncbi:FAD-dependent thymidylate synthase [Clostridium felsineum]|uniref:FAD-dependent thymidylate synthase n=1 Tax=Clostridium felsineum TaxID=36839 RepID=UPI00098C12CD|nr:FAD-dependent thymidylate synthase [Clostridium felsineum]URZ03450.1 Flavin-dependent thymidylate synthase [Clostridium felsineum]